MIIIIDTASIAEAFRVAFTIFGLLVGLVLICLKLEDLWVTYHSNRSYKRWINSDEYREQQEHYRQKALFWESFVGPRKPYDDTALQGPVGIKGPEGVRGPAYLTKDILLL